MDPFFLILSLILPVCGFCFKESFKNVTVKVGEDCDLPCSCSERPDLSIVEWIQDSNHVVLLYRRGRVLTDHQDPQFTDRVKFKYDPPKKDLTVTIRNVTIKDSGFYKCEVFDEVEIYSQIISLRVQDREPTELTWTPTPPTESTLSLHLFKIVPCMIVLICICFCIVIVVRFHRLKQHRKEQNCQRAESETSCPEKSDKNSPFLESAILTEEESLCSQDLGEGTSFASLESD